jgi:cellulose synthase (UDP-forming)
MQERRTDPMPDGRSDSTQRLKERVPWLRPEDPEARREARIWGFRVLATLDIAIGLSYIIWRYSSSLNRHALWFALPLVLAETYSYLSTVVFIFILWKPARRTTPPPIEGATVDVFIATYNEPVELVRLTAEAATRIRWPNTSVYILDDGDRPAMAAMAQEVGCGYIVRGEEWVGKSRHAKAGNVNNALLETSGEFILLLDADQIPGPDFIERTIGYFSDPALAFVQTPQYFYNIQPGDPFGSAAPLFYGPILQGMDGWNAGFLCGSNAILRREALMQLGLTDYVEEMEQRVQKALSGIQRGLSRARADSATQRSALAHVGRAVTRARQALTAGQPLEMVTGIVHQAVIAAQADVAQDDLASIVDDLLALAAIGDDAAAEASQLLMDQLPELARQVIGVASDGADAVGLSPEAAEDLDLTRADEALPVSALATISVTEDFATAMRLHAMGWHSVFHPEILAYGLAPEDLGSALVQRLRWAQGTIQVLLHDNPLTKKGLTWPQRIQYLSTINSYFSGFFSLIYLLAPITFLFTGISPVAAWSTEFAWRLLPLLFLNRFMFFYVARGLNTRRGEQYNLALFPIWIQAVVTVIFGAKLSFQVTPKQRQSGNYLKLVWPQLAVVALTATGIVYGWVLAAMGIGYALDGVLANTFWGCYNISMLLPIIRAATYVPPSGWEARPPDFLFPDGEAVSAASTGATSRCTNGS